MHGLHGRLTGTVHGPLGQDGPGKADGDRDRHVGARQTDLGDRRPDTLGDLEGRGDIGVGQQDRELLPVVAREVRAPHHAAQRGADAR